MNNFIHWDLVRDIISYIPVEHLEYFSSASPMLAREIFLSNIRILHLKEHTEYISLSSTWLVFKMYGRTIICKECPRIITAVYDEDFADLIYGPIRISVFMIAKGCHKIKRYETDNVLDTPGIDKIDLTYIDQTFDRGIYCGVGDIHLVKLKMVFKDGQFAQN